MAMANFSDLAKDRHLVYSLVLILTGFLLPSCQGQSSTTPFPLSSVQARLVGGINEREGRVEVYYNGSWGTICRDGWDVSDAAVICRMLGYAGIARAVTDGTYGAGTGPIFLRGVDCAGNEDNIAFCKYQGWSITVCTHAEDAGAICLGDRLPTTRTTTIGTTQTTLPPRICNNPSPNVRLVNGDSVVSTSAIGRVQYLHNNVWRSICNDRWGINEAAVTCRMLCYNPANARAIISSSEFGNATEGFWLGNVVCNGSETDLASCSHGQWGDTSCNETETAGVSCLLDSPTPPPLPEPTIDCTNEMITAKFSRAADSLLRTDHISVSGPNGEATTCGNKSADATYVSISIPFIGCNTNRTLNGTSIIYNNIVRYAVPSPSNVITRTTIYYVPVSCIINRTADPDNSFNPQTRTPPPQSGSGQYSVQLLLFENNRFDNPVADNPLQVVLGDWLYVGVQLYSSDRSLKLVLIDCFVTPTVSPNSTPLYYLIRNKCVVEKTVTLYPMNDTLVAFRVQSFEFIGNFTSSTMYLHANAYVCGTTENTGNCNRNCFDASSNRRRRRSAFVHEPVSVVSQWQIVVVSDDLTLSSTSLSTPYLLPNAKPSVKSTLATPVPQTKPNPTALEMPTAPLNTESLKHENKVKTDVSSSSLTVTSSVSLLCLLVLGVMY